MKGCYPALITPFTDDSSKIDFDSFANLVEFTISNGVKGLVVAGSTGESQTLNDEEYKSLLKFARDVVKNRCPIYSGISLSSTHKAIEFAKYSKSINIDGVLVATPPYNKPTQEGIYMHMSCINKEANIPVIAYNIPGRSGTAIAPATLARLWNKKIIIAVKESTGSLDNVMDIMQATNGEVPILSGEDSLVHAILSCGGIGTISASANLLPGQFSQMIDSYFKGDVSDSLKIQRQILPTVRAMFNESNPIPVKMAVYMKGIIKSPAVRLPLIKASENTVSLLKELSI